MSLPLSYSLTNENVKQKIKHLINEINQFNDIEKLLLYIQLPSGSPANDPLKHKGPGNPFGKKADVEVAQTYTWIQSHLEEDSTVSLPKHEVYDEYRCFCQANSFEPLCVADFGKAMKHVFPRVKPRRLGQRGNSKYCYSGLRKRLTLPAPCLPDLSNTSTSLNNVVNDNENNNAKVNGDDIRISKSNSVEEDSSSDPSSTGEALGVDKCARKNVNNFTTNNSNGIANVDGKHLVSSDIVHNAATRLILDWAEGILEQNFSDLQELGKYLINYDLVDKTSVAAITLMSSSATLSSGKSELFSSLSSEDVKTNSFNSNFNNKTLLNPIKSKREATQSNVQKKSNIKEIPGNTRRKAVDRTSKSVSSNCINNNNSKSTNNANGNDDSGFVIATSSSSSSSANKSQEAASTVTLTRVNRRSRRLSVNGNGRSMDISGGVGGCALGVNGDNLKSTNGLQSMQVCVKKEAIQNGSNIDTSSANNINNNNTNNGSKTSSPLLKATISQNKIPIPRSGASHHIIVLPNNVQLTTSATRSISQIFTGDKSGSQSVPVTCLSSSSSSSSSLSSSFVSTSSSSSSSSSSTSSISSLSSSCSTIKSTSSLTSPPSLSTATLKYKRIQPKPVSLSRSNSNVLESTFNYSTINEHTTSSSTSTLSSSSNNNNVINSSQGRNINNLANAVNIVNCNNEINTLKSNENETLVVTRRHSLATVPLNGAELVLTSTDRNIGLLNRKDIVIGLGNRGGSGGGSGSGTGGPGSLSGLKEERCLDKTQIKRHCDGSRDSDNNISCKKRYTSAEGCEAVSPLSLSTTSATLFVTSTQPVTSTINGTGSGSGAGAGAGGIILTLANGRSSAETNSSSPSLPSPLPIIGINTLTSDDVLFDGLPDNGLVDDDNDNRQPHQNQAEQPQQLEVNHNHDNIKASTSEMCIKLQELECDALNDDLNEAQQPQQHGASTSSSLMDSYEDCNPSTLSQLRRLLEKNLPNSKSNSNTIGLSIPVTTIPSDPITVAAVAINATNVINNHNNHNHHHQLNLVEQVHRSNEPSNAINGINIINNNHHNHQEMMESTQHHLSYTSNQEATSSVDNNNSKSVGSKAKKYLHPPSGKDDILSSNGSFTAESLVSSAPKKSIDSDCCNSPMLISNFSESDALLVSNGSVIDGAGGNAGGDMVSSMDYCNIQTQIPSVPASPNTRRQAFNFQPISLRITPTIPENSAIGSYVNGTNLSPPSTSSTTTTASLNNLVGGGGNGNGIGNMNGSNNAQQQHSPPTFSSNQRSIGVGLSQPPSSANSPFVSPRGTPIPLSRSRHDSGQSGYSGSRATPYPVLLDSGLSSISSSPFISPQSTPVPLSGRMRALGNCYSHHHSLHSRSSLINRARHSSGPGNPYTTMPASIGGTFSMRSSSVSPMVVSCNGNDLLLSSSNGYNNSNSNINHSGATLASINAAFGETKRTRNQSSTTTTTTTTSGVSSIGTPVSPKSEPLSPSSVFISGDMSTSDLTSIGIASSSSNGGDSFMDSCFTSRDWLTNNSRFLLSGYHGSSDLSSSGVHGLLHGGSNVGPVLRQRHFSSPYATIANNASNNFSLVDPHSKEVQTLFKGSSFIESLLSSSNANNNANANTNDSDNNTVNDSGENSNGSSLTGNLSGDHPHSGSRPVLNRCHSVPIQHLGKLYNGSSFSPLEHGSFTPSSSLYSPADLNSPDRDFSAVSKSYPPTPLCNPNFSFPPTSPSNINTNSGSSSSSNSNNNNSTITNPLISNNSGNNSTLSPSSTRLKLVEEETSLGSLAVDSVASVGSSSSNPTSNFLESGQDVMVSGLQSKDWTVGEAVIGADDIELAVSHPGHFHHREHQRNQHPHHHNHDPDLSSETGLLNTFEVRRTIDDTISGPIPMSDDLETTLEDLRDCDNDFSKFALELELEANGTSKFDDI